jgi:hypothetical protein
MKMKSIFSILVISIITFHLSGQVYEKKVIPAGQNMSTYSDFLFPSFSKAIVKLKDGGKIETNMNFTLVQCDMQFIGPKGDTLSLSDPENVDSIYLNGYVFFYKKGYFQIPVDSGRVKLAILRKTSFEPVKIGAMGMPSHSTAIDNYATVSDDKADTKQLILNVDIYVTRQTNFYFIGDNNSEMINASKSALMKIFSDNKDNIEQFIKANKLSLSNEKDLRKILQFCNGSSMNKNKAKLLFITQNAKTLAMSKG